MAKMFPEILDSNVASRAEVIVLKKLKDQLDKNWTVFYGQPWYSSTKEHSPFREGECDFILLNEELGIMIIEVKGGMSIEYSPADNCWYSTNKNDETFIIKDPYKQVKSNVSALLHTLQSVNQFKDLNRFYKDINVCFCVIFPEIDSVIGYEFFENHKMTTLLKDDLINVEKKIESIFKFHQNEATFSSQLTKDVIDFLIKAKESTVYYRATLKSIIDVNEEVMLKATAQQENVLLATKYMDRLVIQGVAGSGKTLLASKLAVDFAKEGKGVLFICFNRLLGSILEKQIEKPELLDIYIYHDLIDFYHKQNNKKYDFKHKSDEDVFYDLLDYEMKKYDVLIIDEAQDFSDTKITILLQQLNEDGKCFLFMDENQNVIEYTSIQTEGFQRMFLETNLRNAKPIFDKVKENYILSYPITSAGPREGHFEITEPYESEHKVKLNSIIRNTINKLVNQEKIKHSDISIITMTSLSKTMLSDFDLKTVTVSRFNDEYNGDLLRIDTVRRFKGVESNVLIVTELEGILKYPKEIQQKLLYTAFSRAKHSLIIIPSTIILNQSPLIL